MDGFNVFVMFFYHYKTKAFSLFHVGYSSVVCTVLTKACRLPGYLYFASRTHRRQHEITLMIYGPMRRSVPLGSSLRHICAPKGPFHILSEREGRLRLLSACWCLIICLKNTIKWKQAPVLVGGLSIRNRSNLSAWNREWTTRQHRTAGRETPGAPGEAMLALRSLSG